MPTRPAKPVAGPMTASTWGMLLVLGLIWGGSFFFIKVAVADIPPMTLVLLRVALASLALHLYLIGRFGLYAHLRKRWRSFLVLGLLNNAIPFTLIFMGETEIGAGLASILNATTPLWTVLATHVTTTNEKLNGAKIAGCALGLAGTVLLIGPGALTGLGGSVWAEVAVIAASASYALGFAYGRRFSGLPAPVTATGQLSASTLLMLPMALIFDQPWRLALPPLSACAAVLGLAWLSTAFAYILYFRIIQRAGATNTSLVTFIVPPSAILLGVLFLGEHLRGGEFAAMLLIAAGLLCIDGRLQTAWKGFARSRAG